MRISKFPDDESLSGEDKLLGTDSTTGKTKNFPLQLVYDSVEASASSIFLTRIVEIDEESGKDFIQVINEDLTGFTVQTGEVVFMKINDLNSDYKSTYVMIREVVTEAVTYGFTNQVSASQFLLLHELAVDAGEANTLGSEGGSYVLAATKVGVDLRVKGLSVGAGITMSDDGSRILVSSSITQAEINTLADVGEGNATLAATKVGSALKVKSLNFVGANITNSAETIEVDIWSRQNITTDTTLSSTYDKRTIWVNNGLNDVVITIPLGLSTDFACAFIQLGTGNVTFAVSGTSVLGSELKIEGENKQVWLERSPVGVEAYILLGNIIA